MKINYFLEESRKILDKHHLSNWKIKITNAKKTHGQCFYRKKTISISKYLIILEQNEENIWDTLLHEIAHALDFYRRNTSNHDEKWKNIALSIGCNGNIEGYEDTFLMDTYLFSRYKGKCNNCDKTFYKEILSKGFIYKCSDCKDNNNILFERNNLNVEDYQ